MPASVHHPKATEIHPERLRPKPLQVALAVRACHLLEGLGVLLLVLGGRLIARIVVRA